jgi:hypothetical protein
MGSVILLGVLADQQVARYRQRSLAQARRSRGAPEHTGEAPDAAVVSQQAPRS